MYVKNDLDISHVRGVVEKYAISNEFEDELATSLADDLAKTGQFIVTFERKDNSYIAIGNVFSKNCISISIYSSIGENDAKQHLMALREKIEMGFDSEDVGFRLDVNCELLESESGAKQGKKQPKESSHLIVKTI